MELFVLKNQRHEVVARGFTNKASAKEERNRLVRALGYTEEKMQDLAVNSHAWPIVVSRGKHHYKEL